jgi:hypothetical protein
MIITRGNISQSTEAQARRDIMAVHIHKLIFNHNTNTTSKGTVLFNFHPQNREKLAVAAQYNAARILSMTTIKGFFSIEIGEAGRTGRTGIGMIAAPRGKIDHFLGVEGVTLSPVISYYRSSFFNLPYQFLSL